MQIKIKGAKINNPVRWIYYCMLRKLSIGKDVMLEINPVQSWKLPDLKSSTQVASGVLSNSINFIVLISRIKIKSIMKKETEYFLIGIGISCLLIWMFV